jgi:aminoglycoside 6'-N-acetyltransferase I
MGSMNIRVRHIAPADAPEWKRLRDDLWPDGRAEHAAEIASFFAGTLEEPVAVVVAESPAGEIVAFAELSLRTDVAGLEGTRVGYVEGLYVAPSSRKSDVARQLLHWARSWARQQSCAAFASDRADRIIVYKRF